MTSSFVNSKNMSAGDNWCPEHKCWNCMNTFHTPFKFTGPYFGDSSAVTNIELIDEKKQRKYMPTLAELLDRLAITQQKEIYITEHREEYTKEIQDILYDIQLILDEEKPVLTAEVLRAVIILTQMNTWIWNNESNFRKGIKEGNNLELTHGLNSIRNNAKNKIQEVLGGRKDYKLDNVEAFKQWVPSGYNIEDEK